MKHSIGNIPHSIRKQLVFIKFIAICLLTPSLSTATQENLDIRPHEAPDHCNPDTAQVRVTVNGVGPGGILSVELYHDPDHFLYKKGRTKRIRIPATDDQHIVCFNLEKLGTYAVAAYHDRDANRKLNKKWNMMPKEPFGLSNNPELHFGFPEFDESAFITDERGADIVIELRQP